MVRLRPSIRAAVSPSERTRGCIYHEAEERELAFTAYRKALECNDRYAPAYYWRGALNQARSLAEAAIRDYRSFLEILPEHPWATDLKRRIQALREDLGSEPLSSGMTQRTSMRCDGLSVNGLRWRRGGEVQIQLGRSLLLRLRFLTQQGRILDALRVHHGPTKPWPDNAPALSFAAPRASYLASAHGENDSHVRSLGVGSTPHPGEGCSKAGPPANRY